MSEIFNILISLSRLLFSSPAFMKLAETSFSEAHQVQDSSVKMCSSPAFREVPIFPPLLEAAATTRPSSRNTECPQSLDALGRSDTFFNAPAFTPFPTLDSESATSSTNIRLGDSTSSIVSGPHCPPPPSNSDDDILTLNSFSFSLVSDNSLDDESGSLDTLLSSSSLTLQSSKLLPRASGLGISGLTRKDGSEPFDGLGIISVESPSPWCLVPSDIRRNGIQGFRRHPSSFSSSAYDSSSESKDFDKSLLLTGDRISNLFLQETFLTFTKDPFHELCHSSVNTSDSIPDFGHNSWSELGIQDESASACKPELINIIKSQSTDGSPSKVVNYRRRIPKLSRTNFSSATISSELKRSSTIIIPESTLRTRSSSWPSSTAKDTAATPLPRCKWRL